MSTITLGQALVIVNNYELVTITEAKNYLNMHQKASNKENLTYEQYLESQIEQLNQMNETLDQIDEDTPEATVKIVNEMIDLTTKSIAKIKKCIQLIGDEN